MESTCFLLCVAAGAARFKSRNCYRWAFQATCSVDFGFASDVDDMCFRDGNPYRTHRDIDVGDFVRMVGRIVAVQMSFASLVALAGVMAVTVLDNFHRQLSMPDFLRKRLLTGEM